MRYLIATALTAFVIVGFVSPSEGYSLNLFSSKEYDLKVFGKTSEVFDDNITYLPQNEKKDLITELTGGVAFRIDKKLQKLDFKAESREQLFAQNTNFNNNAQDARLKYQLELSKKDRLSVSEMFKRYTSPRSFEEAFGRSNGRYYHTKNAIGIEYAREILERWTATGRYGNELDFLSRPDLQDSVQHGAGFQTDFAWSTASIFSLIYDFLHRGYERSKGISINSAAGGYRHYFTKQLFADLRGGLSLVSLANQILVRPLYSVSVTGDLDDRTQILLAFQRMSVPSVFSVDTFDSWQLKGSLQRQITKRIKGAVTAFYGRGEFETRGIKNNQWGANAGLEYEFSTYVLGGVSYTYTNVDSSNEFQEYSKNTASANVSVTF